MTGIPPAMAVARGVLSARFDKYGCDSIMIEFPFSGNEAGKRDDKSFSLGAVFRIVMNSEYFGFGSGKNIRILAV